LQRHKAIKGTLERTQVGMALEMKSMMLTRVYLVLWIQLINTSNNGMSN